jgi:hypothetical protein
MLNRMECVLCGHIVLWVDRLGRCRLCSPFPVDTYSTELLPLAPEPEAAVDGDVCEADALLAS